MPKLDCYLLKVDGTEVGGYRYDALIESDWNVGYIASESVWGDPETGNVAQADQDWPGCAADG